MVKQTQIDLVMWTLNGEKTLPQVLNRINEVIPEELVNNKFVVDDHSKDNTREIATAAGWTVKFNQGKGIADGANTALRLVETERYCSFEQDLLLSRHWWKLLNNIADWKKGRLAVASGVRFSDKPRCVTKMQEYVYSKYLEDGDMKMPAWLRHRRQNAFTLGKTFDNTMYRTEAMLEVGGYPDIGCNAGIDTVLAYKLHKIKWLWAVDYRIRSTHIRVGGLKQELKHQRFYASTLKKTRDKLHMIGVKSPVTMAGSVFRLATSPFTGTFMAVKTGTPQIAIVHPLIRMAYLRGTFDD